MKMITDRVGGNKARLRQWKINNRRSKDFLSLSLFLSLLLSFTLLLRIRDTIYHSAW